MPIAIGNDYERIWFEILDNFRRQFRSSATILGGASGPAGGTGGPPAGFNGLLPQTRVAFDTTEASISGIPPTPSGTAITSGPTLLTNLNRIRWKIGGVGTPSISGILTLVDNTPSTHQNIVIVDLKGDYKVTYGGTTAYVDVPIHVVNEDLTSQVDGVTSGFTTNNNYISGKLQVFLDGVKERGISVTEYGDQSGFYLATAPTSGTVLEADYLYYSR